MDELNLVWPTDRIEGQLARALERDEVSVEDDPAGAEYHEALTLVNRTLQCVDHCKRAIAQAERAGDFELSLLLEDALCDATLRARLVREALVSRASRAAQTSTAHSDVHELAPRTATPVGLPASSGEPGWEYLQEAARAQATLVIHSEGRSFVLPSGRHVDCGDRRVMRRILIRLARQRQHAPGVPVSIEELLRVGWPGDAMDGGTGRNRLRVTIVRLRRLGLYGLLQSHQRGYMFDPALVVRIVCNDPWH